MLGAFFILFSGVLVWTTVQASPLIVESPASVFETCGDDHASCLYWASIGECKANPAYMTVYCRKSCQQCTVPVTRPPTTVAQCSNYWSTASCQQSKSYGHCQSREAVKYFCRNTCGLCGSYYDIAAAPGVMPAEPSCANYWSAETCSTSALRGHCKTRQAVKYFCRSTCGLCAAHYDLAAAPRVMPAEPTCANYWSAETCRTSALRGHCKTREAVKYFCRSTCDLCDGGNTQNPTTKSTWATFTRPSWSSLTPPTWSTWIPPITKTTRKTTTQKPTTPFIPPAGCQDYWPVANCNSYSHLCSSRNDVQTMCRKTCNLCHKNGECPDQSGNCAYWAGRGECQRNPGYMFTNCKKSCSIRDC